MRSGCDTTTPCALEKQRHAAHLFIFLCGSASIAFAWPEKRAQCRKTKCRDPGSNRGPSDLQSDALPTELSRLCFKFEAQSITKQNTANCVCFIGKQWRCHYGAAAASSLAHLSATTPGTRDKCLPLFIRPVFANQSSPWNTNSAREHALDSRVWLPLAFCVNLEIGLSCNWPRGPMDKASAYGAGDCRFESCRGHFWFC